MKAISPHNEVINQYTHPPAAAAGDLLNARGHKVKHELISPQLCK